MRLTGAGIDTHIQLSTMECFYLWEDAQIHLLDLLLHSPNMAQVPCHICLNSGETGYCSKPEMVNDELVPNSDDQPNFHNGCHRKMQYLCLLKSLAHRPRGFQKNCMLRVM